MWIAPFILPPTPLRLRHSTRWRPSVHPRLASANHPNSPPPSPSSCVARLAGGSSLRFVPARAVVPKATSSARFFTKAGLVEDMKAKIDDYQAKEKLKGIVATPPGVPPPPYVPVLKPGSFGFVENAERWNSRASMVGWWSLLLVELVAGKGLLEIFGFTVGKGINFTF